MNLRNAIQAIFGGTKQLTTSSWREIGNYTAGFSSFGTDAYANDTVRACIRTLSEQSSKANVKVVRRVSGGIVPGDLRLQKMIQYRPNLYMNGKDFLAKIRTLLEINNMVFIYVMRDDTGSCIGYYPMPAASRYESMEYGGMLYIKFYFTGGVVMTHSWDDLAVLRKDYNTSDLWGDSNNAILTSLNLLTTTNEGMANAIKSTANIRGILKSTKAMLSPDDVKRTKEQFVADYMGLANTSGIASLDATQDFKEINLTPQIANYKTVADLRMNIHQYFGVSPEMILSKANSDEREAFYEGRIEPFLLALGLELTYKTFTDRKQTFGNEILFEANRMSYMSQQEKIALVAMVDRGAMTPNEWRESLNLAPIAGGDIPIRRLDTAPTSQTAQTEEDDPDDQPDA